MTIEEECKTVAKKKNVLVGIRIDSHSRELLNWALVKVAEPGDSVVALHVTRDSDRAVKDKPLLDGYLEVYQGLCNVKQVSLDGKILKGNCIRRVLTNEAKNFDAAAVIVGISRLNALGGWASVARYCAKRLPATTEVIAVHNGKVVFRRCSVEQLSALRGDPRPTFYSRKSPKGKESRSEFGDSEAESEYSTSEVQSSNERSIVGGRDSKENFFSPVNARRKTNTRSISLFAGDPSEQTLGWPSEQTLGWPLLGRTSTVIPKALHTRKLSVAQWVMSLPHRSPPDTPQSSRGSKISLEIEIGEHITNCCKNSPSWGNEIFPELGILFKTSSSGCRWFSLEVLKTATSQFSSENLIGKGGCNCVYKGYLPDGKPVAVKIMKSTKEAQKDFSLEVEIISILNHKHITPLLGICVEDGNLISVYDYLSKGSLEENLHGTERDKKTLSWEKRFNVAVGVAEALNYLHKECSRPVIHRDVKSSNILLSDELEPQLSDFGLAIWGPTTSSFLTQVDVAGTFGYLAPEYFMYGKVSEKIDVYSFGVILLELLSGRRAISSETPKGQESLVMWAKPKIESGDIKGLLDSGLDGDIDEDQVQKMGLAATLCLTQAARLRPKMDEILKLLRGEKDVEKLTNFQMDGQGDLGKQDDDDDDDDEVYPDSCAESHLSLALLDVTEDSTSFSSVEQTNSLSVEEYLKGRFSRSSSLD